MYVSYGSSFSYDGVIIFVKIIPLKISMIKRYSQAQRQKYTKLNALLKLWHKRKKLVLTVL